MVKKIQTIRWENATSCLSVFDHFVGLALKGLSALEELSSASYSFLNPLVPGVH